MSLLYNAIALVVLHENKNYRPTPGTAAAITVLTLNCNTNNSANICKVYSITELEAPPVVYFMTKDP